jgi:hypothetical protein
MAFLPIPQIDARPSATKLPVVFRHRKANPRMQHPSSPEDRSSRSPLDRRSGDLSAVLLTLAIGLAVLDGTCFAAFKLIHAVTPLIETVPGVDQPWAPPGARAAHD